MPLDKTTLQSAIKAAFKKAKDTPPPDDPNDASQVQEQILTDLSADLANALDAFARGADVVQITVDVKNNASVLIGTGTQTGVGKIQ